MSDLPAITRWTPARKAAVVARLAAGDVSRDRVISAYGLTHEELTGWEARHASHGQQGLRTTLRPGRARPERPRSRKARK